MRIPTFTVLRTFDYRLVRCVIVLLDPSDTLLPNAALVQIEERVQSWADNTVTFLKEKTLVFCVIEPTAYRSCTVFSLHLRETFGVLQYWYELLGHPRWMIRYLDQTPPLSDALLSIYMSLFTLMRRSASHCALTPEECTRACDPFLREMTREIAALID
jgi:hypothetical protein